MNCVLEKKRIYFIFAFKQIICQVSSDSIDVISTFVKFWASSNLRMSNNRDVSRLNYLSLNLKTIKSLENSVPHIKLTVSNGNIDSPLIDPSTFNPSIFSRTRHFLLSRNKVGNELIKRCRNGFQLDDPYMKKSRFFVDYHRMHDPALKHYFHSIPVRDRLKRLELINQQNDAMCSTREFTEYIRYLESIRAHNEAYSQKIKVFFLKFCCKRTPQFFYSLNFFY